MDEENQDLMGFDSDEEEDDQGALMMLQQLYLWTESTVDNDKAGALSDIGDMIENVMLRLNQLRLQSKGAGGNSSAEVAAGAAKAEGSAGAVGAAGVAGAAGVEAAAVAAGAEAAAVAAGAAAAENATGGADPMQSICDLPSTEAEVVTRIAEELYSMPDESADAIIANMMILVGNKPYNQPD